MTHPRYRRSVRPDQSEGSGRGFDRDLGPTVVEKAGERRADPAGCSARLLRFEGRTTCKGEERRKPRRDGGWTARFIADDRCMARHP